VLGKHSGRHAVQRRCEMLGLTVDRQELDLVYRGVIEHADREKIVTDADLVGIVARVRGEASRPVVLVSSMPDFSTTPAESGYGHGV
jgi:isopropylmalate/homocitrate/citramalate synthase